MIVYGFEKHRNRPTLTFDTGDSYPPYLVHANNVLVFQSLGGSANHVYVFTFNAGKPSLALQTATADQIHVERTQTASVVSVPPKTYSGPDGTFPKQPKPKVYSFPLD